MHNCYKSEDALYPRISNPTVLAIVVAIGSTGAGHREPATKADSTFSATTSQQAAPRKRLYYNLFQNVLWPIRGGVQGHNQVLSRPSIGSAEGPW